MMTPSAPAAHGPAFGRGLGRFLNRSEAWLDSKGRGAWIGAMVLGFIVFWPVGLALVFYITLTNRWSKPMFGQTCRNRQDHSHRHHGHWGHQGRARTSGNTAFDAYKAETLRRLEEEQTAFETFLERLRAAKDKTEFDNFMEDRARSAPQNADDADDNAMPPIPGTGGGSAPGAVPQSY